MRRSRRRNQFNLVLALTLILCVVVLATVAIEVLGFFEINKQEEDKLEFRKEKMVDRATEFYEAGKLEIAIRQIEVYLNTSRDDVEAWKTLLLWYEESQNSEKSAECRRQITLLTALAEQDADDASIILNAVHPAAYFKNELNDFTIRIKADTVKTEPCQISVISNNLCSMSNVHGTIIGTNQELRDEDSLTTDWFYIDSHVSDTLTLCGGFNTAVWQFKNVNDEIIGFKSFDATYNNLESKETGNEMCCTVSIPEGGVMARVTYWNAMEENTVPAGEISIVYGSYPQKCGQPAITTVEIPALQIGEEIVYELGTARWTLYRNGSEVERLPLGKISINPYSTVSLVGNVVGSMLIIPGSIVPDEVFDGEYGVRWKVDSLDPVCERVGSSQFFDFGYRIGDAWIGTGKRNDFDNVKPWSDIRLCAINSNGEINYGGFDVADERLDIMVEIPQFWFKREIQDGYEYMWISSTEKEGYSVDPAFLSEEGMKEHVYVAAYLSSQKTTGEIASVSGKQPLVNISLNSAKEMAMAKGNGWAELDLITLNAIQKLFLVETANKNSQSLFMGVVNLAWRTPALGTSSVETNSIIIANNAKAKRMAVGDTVTIFDAPIDENYYDYLLKYENTPAWIRRIQSIQSNDKQLCTIVFSGDPVVVTEGVTNIMNLPNMNGKSDKMNYHTGQIDDDKTGKTSFRYRYMENLWGNGCVLLDGATVTQRVAEVRYPNGEIKSVIIPDQSGTTSEGVSPARSSVRAMSLVDDCLGVLLPKEVGNGASATTAYCDSLFYPNSSKPRVFTYGLTWDLKQYAGLFSYRAVFDSETARIESTSRMIYR